MSEVLHRLEDGNVMFFCPGCNCGHKVWVSNPHSNGAKWIWNGRMDKPTFTPSLLISYGASPPADRPATCHSFVMDGKIQFLSDSTHKLAGQTVALDPFP